MGNRGSKSGIGSGKSRGFNKLSDANEFFGVGESSGMFPDWEQAVTDAEKKSAILYTKSAYRAMNKYLRSGEDAYKAWAVNHHDYYFNGNPEAIEEHAKRIDAAMDKFDLKQNIVVWRGGSSRLVNGASTVAELKAMIGAVVRDKGIMSTAVTKAAACGMEGSNIGYEVEIPKGRGRGIFIDPVSANRGEEEFMVRRNTRYQITGAYTDTHGNVICKLKAIFR